MNPGDSLKNSGDRFYMRCGLSFPMNPGDSLMNSGDNFKGELPLPLLMKLCSFQKVFSYDLK